MLRLSVNEVNIKGKLSELIMLQFSNNLEYFLEGNENERKNIIEKCKNKINNYNMFINFFNDVVYSQYKDIRIGFLELIENSLDAMIFDRGDISVKINTNKKDCEFSVTDIGHGMTLKALVTHLVMPFKSTKRDHFRSSYYGGKGIGFQVALSLSDSVRIITSSGHDINELELKKIHNDWEYQLSMRDGKVTGTTIIGNLKHGLPPNINDYIKKYFYFINPDKYRINVNGEKINIGKDIYRNTTFKYPIQKNGIKNNIFLYSVKDGKCTFNIYRKGRYIKNYKDILKFYPIVYDFISALMCDGDYSFVIEIPDIIELTGKKDDFFIDDKSNVENSIRKMLEAYILSEVIPSENILRKIEHKLLNVYETLFEEMIKDNGNINRVHYYGYNESPKISKGGSYSSYILKKLASSKFINVVQFTTNSFPKKIKTSLEELYDYVKKRKVTYINNLTKTNTGIFVEEGNIAIMSLLNVDSSYYNYIKNTNSNTHYNQQYINKDTQQYNKNNQIAIILKKTSLHTFERILNIEKKTGEYVILLRIFKYLDEKISKALNIQKSEISLHSHLTVNNDEVAITDSKSISLNISNRIISLLCNGFLKKNTSSLDIIKMLDIIIYEKSRIFGDYYVKGEYYSIEFYETIKSSVKNDFINYIYNNKIDIFSDIMKIVKKRPHSEKTKIKDVMGLVKKHSIKFFTHR